MRLTTLAITVIAAVFLLAFYRPVVEVWNWLSHSLLRRWDFTAIDVMVVIAIALIALRCWLGVRSPSAPPDSMRTDVHDSSIPTAKGDRHVR